MRSLVVSLTSEMDLTNADPIVAPFTLARQAQSNPSSPSCFPGGWPSLSDQTGQRKERENIQTHCCCHHLTMGNNSSFLVAWH